MFNRYSSCTVLGKLAILAAVAALAVLVPSYLGGCYAERKDVPKDPFESLMNSDRQAAEQGDARAQVRLGLYYYDGEGVPQDHTEAVKWFRKAVEHGLADAQFYMGLCYYKGEGVPQDHTEAVKWFRKAAEKEYANAQWGLGVCYYRGEGVSQDHTEAVQWYRKAAEQEYASAQFNLGVCYYKGEGVPKDLVLAYKWSNLAGATDEKAREWRDTISRRMTPEQIAEAQRLSREWKPMAAE